ncbi:MAG: molybdopterin-guanine dinucleotide biosynthesis protein MobA [Nocardioides sp.]|nr:molybdopterin-guanine dinucleotide biosynthesis protein MobA [Nocardioides sp.]
MTYVAGLLLAAGAGRRMGGPKALVRHDDGTPWVAGAVGVLVDGGCGGVTVVLGASAEEARPLVPAAADVVVADHWADGMGASLRAGLAALESGPADAALVLLVDLPDLVPAVVARLLADASGPAALARAAYEGVPGHPVLLGRDHWAGVADTAVGDRGARDYLAAHAAVVRPVECGDLATGADRDRPE